MVVYRCLEAPIGQMTREKDVFSLGADFGVPGAKLFFILSYMLLNE